jgi:hypothetical protein
VCLPAGRLTIAQICDIDGDGVNELLIGTYGQELVVYKQKTGARASFLCFLSQKKKKKSKVVLNIGTDSTSGIRLLVAPQFCLSGVRSVVHGRPEIWSEGPARECHLGLAPPSGSRVCVCVLDVHMRSAYRP